jgi:hypothetical protein
MKLYVKTTDVWAATIEDRPGGLHKKLAALAQAGANLEFLVSRRAPDKPGKGVVFVTPLTGANQTKAAAAAGFKKSAGLHSVRVEGSDKAGVGAMLTDALTDAGLNLRGASGAAFGRRFVVYLALDTAADAAKAVSTLKKLSQSEERGVRPHATWSKRSTQTYTRERRERSRTLRRGANITA